MTNPTSKKRTASVAKQRTRKARSAVSLVLILCLVSTLAMLVGCEEEASKRPSLTEQEIADLSRAVKPTRPDELFVSGEVITCEDVMKPAPVRAVAGTPTFREQLVDLAKVTTLDEFMELARPQIRARLNDNMSNIILYRRARRTLGENVDQTLDTAADKAMNQFVLEHGGNDADADEALRAMGQTRRTFKEQWKKQELARYAYMSTLPSNRPITYSELVAAYDQMKDAYFIVPGEIQFRLIDIQPARMELSDPNEDPVAAARALAASLVTRIMAGEDFAALAEEYSNGFRAQSGGLWTPRDPESMAEQYQVLAEAAEQIEPGQIAGPLDAPGHFYIMKLVSKRAKSYRPLAEVQEQVERQVAANRNAEALADLELEVAQQITVADTSSFVDYCLEHVYRLANETATGQ